MPEEFGNARDFSTSLMNFVTHLSKDMENMITHVAFRVLDLIYERSPVDTGKFKASNTVKAGGSEPVRNDGVFEGAFAGMTREARSRVALDFVRRKNKKFRWKIRNDCIWIYNNVPYANRLEHGHSRQAPSGVYAVSVAEFDTLFQEQLQKYEMFR